MTALPAKRYDCIVIDPPWQYNLRRGDRTHRNAVDYSDVSLPEILALPVPSLLKPTTVIWLWTTNNFMGEAFECLAQWGLTQKTILTWVKTTNDGTKTRLGVGHWLRNCTEHCLVAIAPSARSFKSQGLLTNQPTILYAPRREHSRKPDQAYQLIEQMCSGNRLDMFARESRLGWDTWGNESTKFDLIA